MLEYISIYSIRLSKSFYTGTRSCLWAIKKWGTGTNSTEVHILDPRTHFTTYINQTGTILPETNDDYYFLAGKYNQDYYHYGSNICDLWAIKKKNTASGNFEVKVLSGEENFQYLLANVNIPIQIDYRDAWQFALGDYNDDYIADLYMFKVYRDPYISDPGGEVDGPQPKIEIHIRNGCDLTSSLLDVNTPLDQIDPSRIQMCVGGIPAPHEYSPRRSFVFAILKNGTGSQTTEVHILDIATNYQTFWLQTGTILHETYNNFEFATAQFLDYRDNNERIENTNSEKISDGTFCYPNPFNPKTNIFYSVGNPSNVSIKVFDLMGRLIDILVDERKEKGRYNIVFDANNLSSGIYFYKANIGEKVYVKKLVVQK